MQRIVKQSKALLLLLAFVLVFSPLSALADAGKTKTVNYVALGDSLAKGTLNTNEASEGYVGNIVSDLEESGYQVNLTNKGENGFKTNDVLNGLEEITTELASADIITISVGANDVLEDLMRLIKQNPDLLAGFKPEYMTPEGIAQLQQSTEEAAATAIVAGSAAQAATEKAQLDVNAAKAAIDEITAIAGILIAGLRTYYEENLDPPLLDIALGKINEFEKAIADAVASVADGENIGVEELENALAVLNSSLEIIAGVDPSFIPNEFKASVDEFKAYIATTATAVDTANVSVENENIAVNTAIEARATAEAAQLLLSNVMTIASAFGGIEGKTQTVGENIGKILGIIKNANPTAEIYVMGYYNALPYVDKDVVEPLLDGLNFAIQAPTKLVGATFIPTAKLFEESNYLVPNPTNIHPNEAGYAAIAEAFMEPIRSAFPGYTPDVKKINLGEKTNVSADEQLYIDEADVFVILPEDLPEGTTLTVTPPSNEALAKAKAQGLKDFGSIFNFTFEFPEGSEDYEGSFLLAMGYDADSPTDVDIYYFNEEKGVWESQKGEIDEEAQFIGVEVSHFSTYGVFAKDNDDSEDPEDPEDPPATDDPTDDDKTPPVTKDPTKGTDKDSKDIGKKTTTTGGAKLPKTATNNYALLLLGTILLVSGSASLMFMRKKRLITNEL